MGVDLATRYLGLALRSPLVASASPLTGSLEGARRLEAAGAGALVLPSLFEEEILHEELNVARALEAGSDQFAEALDYFPAVDGFVGAGERYLETIRRTKAAVGIPVIASLNAVSAGGWVRSAQSIQEAGADALELNLYEVAAAPERGALEIESAHLDLVAAVRMAVSIPVAVKIGPYYSALANFAAAVVARGANGLVLFNRFYQPDLDLETFDVVPRLELSRSAELRLPLRWTAILRPQLGRDVSIAASSGVHTGIDAVKVLMAGADVAMTTSALLRHGAEHLATLETELREWLEAHEYDSVGELRGSATHASSGDPAAFERANYAATLHSWSGELP